MGTMEKTTPARIMRNSASFGQQIPNNGNDNSEAPILVKLCTTVNVLDNGTYSGTIEGISIVARNTRCEVVIKLPSGISFVTFVPYNASTGFRYNCPLGNALNRLKLKPDTFGRVNIREIIGAACEFTTVLNEGENGKLYCNLAALEWLDKTEAEQNEATEAVDDGEVTAESGTEDKDLEGNE